MDGDAVDLTIALVQGRSADEVACGGGRQRMRHLVERRQHVEQRRDRVVQHGDRNGKGLVGRERVAVIIEAVGEK